MGRQTNLGDKKGGCHRRKDIITINSIKDFQRHIRKIKVNPWYYIPKKPTWTFSFENTDWKRQRNRGWESTTY